MELICVFVDLQKPYHRVPREELWYWTKKSKVAEKYASVVEDIYKTVVRCRVEVTDGFKMQLGLYHRCSESPSLFVIVLDKLADEVRHGLQCPGMTL